MMFCRIFCETFKTEPVILILKKYILFVRTPVVYMIIFAGLVGHYYGEPPTVIGWFSGILSKNL